MKKRKIILFLFVILHLTGCSGKGEFGQVLIAQGMAVDSDEKGNLRIAFQIFNPSELASSSATNRSEVLTYEFKVKKGEAVESVLLSELPGELMLSHVTTIIYGSDVVKKGFNKFIDKIIRLNRVSPQAKIYIAKDIKAVDMLKVLTSAQKIPSQQIGAINGTANKQNSMSVEITPYEAAEIISTEGVELVLPAITLDGRAEDAKNLNQLRNIEPAVKIKLAGLAVFKGESFVGFLPITTSIFKNILTNKGTSYYTGFACEKNKKKYNEYVLSNLQTKVKSELMDGRVHFDIQTTANANLSYEGCEEAFSIKSMNDMEKEIEATFKKEMLNEIQHVQREFGTDIFGFGMLVYKQHKHDFKEISKEWNDVFKKATFTVKTDVTVSKVGVMKEPLKVEGKGK